MEVFILGAQKIKNWKIIQKQTTIISKDYKW